jgi:uncharacterized membrane protein YbhN (UPF0104 family)
LREQLAAFPWKLSWGWLLASMALATTNLFLMAGVWVGLFRSRGGSVAFRPGSRIWLVTNLGRYIPGKVWQFVGMTAYMKGQSGQGALALGATVTFQVLIILTGGAVALAALGTRALSVPGGSAARLAWLIVALLILLHPKAMRGLTRLAGRLLGEETGPEVGAARDYARAAVGLLVAWAVYGFGFWCLARGTMAGPLPSPSLLTGVFAAAYVVGYLALVAPGGIVIREGAIAGLLAALTPLGLGVAAALAVMTRIWITLSELVAVALAALPAPEPERRKAGKGRGADVSERDGG